MQTKCVESQKCKQNWKVTPQAKNPYKHESIACRISYNADNDRCSQHFGTGLIPTGFIIKICNLRHAKSVLQMCWPHWPCSAAIAMVLTRWSPTHTVMKVCQFTIVYNETSRCSQSICRHLVCNTRLKTSITLFHLEMRDTSKSCWISILTFESREKTNINVV